MIPLWSALPPETIRNWNPTLTISSRNRFWRLIHPALIVAAMMALVAWWQTLWKHRRWLLGSRLTSLLVEGATVTYYVPTLVTLLVEHGQDLSAEE